MIESTFAAARALASSNTPVLKQADGAFGMRHHPREWCWSDKGARKFKKTAQCVQLSPADYVLSLIDQGRIAEAETFMETL